jgi:glycosyltransferase involved in cell wall biosynthesis
MRVRILSTLRSKPAISIVMLSYNHVKFTSEAIASALDQTVDLEVVIVDDCSDDGSPALIRKWVQKDSRVRALFHDKNLGIAATANDGIESACGRYILLASSDDMLIPSTLACVVSFLDSRQDIGAAILNAECIDSSNRKLGFKFSEWRSKPSLTEGYFFRYLVRGNFVCTGVVRKSVIDDTGIRYNPALKYLNDWIFWLELSHTCKFVYFEQPIYRYRIHPSAASTDSKGFASDTAAYDIILEKYEKELDPQAKAHILRNMGVDYCFSGDLRKARMCLHESLKANRAPLPKLAVVSLIALSYQTSLFRIFVGVWRHRYPNRILVRWRRK